MPERVRFDHRLLAETQSIWESLESTPIDDRAANELASTGDGDFEQRLIARARALPSSKVLRDATHQVRGAFGLLVFAALIAAAAGGAAAARACLGAPRNEPINFFHVFGVLLGVQTLLLIAWFVVMIFRRSAAAALSIASLGGVLLRAAQALLRRIRPGHAYAAAVAGFSRALVRGALGRWTFSAISHGLWLAFNVGCLAMLIFLLSTRQYAFGWETTILSAGTYKPLTKEIAALPHALGFDAPSDEQIEDSQWKGERRADYAASQAWSALLVGSLVVYGLGPRLLLVGLSLGQRRLAKTRYRLDVERPEFAGLRSLLEPASVSIGVVDHDVPATHPPQRRIPHAPGRPAGLPAIVGFELPARGDGAIWPPRLHNVRWNDLGMIDTREDRRRVIDELSRSGDEPAALIIVCDLTTTPDRGVSAFLAEACAAISRPPLLVLTGGQRLRDRTDSPHGQATTADFDARLDDWRTMASGAGVPRERIVDIDLEHLTHNTQAKLAAMIETPPGAVGPGIDATVRARTQPHERRLDQAFALIIDFARDRSSREPAEHDQAELHRAIAQLYGDHATDWPRLLRVPTDIRAFLPQSLGQTLKSSAQRFADLLPERLKRSPKWLAAGATAGALGCVASAAFISPIAIGALPLWSGLGAAIAAIAQPSPRADQPGEREQAVAAANAAGMTAETVRSAALFAMLLELQGFDERVITRVLDATIIDDAAAEAPHGAGDLQRWLNDLGHRFDLALAHEQQSRQRGGS